MLQGLGCFKFAPNGFCIVALCRGKMDGRDFYAFMAIEPQNYGYFKKRYRDGEDSSFNVFGFELFRGWGQEPSEALIEHLRLKHGIQFGLTQEFLDRVAHNSFGMQVRPVSRDWYTSQLSGSAL